MRRYRPALIALVLLGLVLPAASDALRRKRSGVSSTAVLSLPLTSSGARFSDDAGTKSHVVFDGVSITDLYGNSWSMVGTVPQVGATAMPTTQDTGAAGPYSASNYYTLGTGSDVLDTDQQVHGCIAFYMSAAMAYGVLYDNSLNATRGRILRLDLGPVLAFITFDPLNRGVSAAVTEGTAGIPALNVACWWHTSSEVGINVNGTESISLGAWTEVPGTSDQTRLGIESAGTTYPFVEGGIIEFTESTGVACPGASCSAWAADQVLRKFGAAGLTTTRATPATYENDGRVWRAPSGIPRITPLGLLTEETRINRITQSENISAWTLTGTCPVVTDQGPDGWTDLDRVTCATTGDYRSFATATAGSTSCSSVWVAATSGTADVYLREFSAATYSGCTCTRSDGGTCTITACTSSNVVVNVTVGTTPVRVWMCSTHGNGAPTLWMRGVAGGTAFLAGRAQVEVNVAQPSSYIPSITGTPVQRNVDLVTTPWPAVATGNAVPWCVAATHTPYSGTRDAVSQTTFWGSNLSSSNTACGFYPSASSVLLPTVNNASGTRYLNRSADTAGSDQSVACQNGAGAFTGCWNASCATATMIGGGTGIPAVSYTTARIGSADASCGSAAAHGYISNFRICRGSNPNNPARCR